MMPTGQAKRTTAHDPPGNCRAEIELLLCCARTDVGAAVASRIRALARSEIDWDRLRVVAFAQGVGPLVGRTLRQTCPDGVPERVLEEWQSRAHASARRGFLLTGHLLRLLTSFRTAGLRVIPFKGPTLAMLAYGDLALRPFADIDVLVHKRDVAQAMTLLDALGYRPRRRHPWEAEFQDAGGTSVDLHWAIAPSYDPIPQTFDQLWARVVPVTLLGAEVATLAPDDLLLVLGIQLAKDSRELRQRLLQLCDTSELLRSHPELDWDHVFEGARAAGGERILLLDLLLVHDLLDGPVPEAVLRVAQDNRPLRALAREFEARMFQPGDHRHRRASDPGLRSEGAALYVRARERLRDKIRFFGLRARDRIGLAVHPTRSDREFFPLPPRLGFLYYLVRPVRVLSRWVRTGRIGSDTRHNVTPS